MLKIILSEFLLLLKDLILPRAFFETKLKVESFDSDTLPRYFSYPLWLGLEEDRLESRCEHLRLEAELLAGVGLVHEPHVERGEDLDPRGDGMFHHRALTIWADLSQVR